MYYSDLSPEEKLKLYAEYSMPKEQGNEFLEQKAKALKQSIPKEEKPIEYKKKKTKDSNAITTEIDSLNVSNQDKEYLKRLAKLESGYNVNIKNPYGYVGLYQIGKDYAKQFNHTQEELYDNSKLQHELALKGVDFNTKGLEKYIGTTYEGIPLTRWNLAAAAHLGGKGNLMKLLSGKIDDFKDANGTSIKSRLKIFGDIS